MRRATLICATMALALVLCSGVALAKDITGTPGPDEIKGTINIDTIYGLSGNDILSARGGDDEVYGGRGNDEIRGSSGRDELFGGTGFDVLLGGGANDFINSADNGRPDTVNCGDGANDRAVVDTEDVHSNCEDVTTVL